MKNNRTKQKMTNTEFKTSKQFGLDKFWTSTQRQGGVKKLPTGIKGFDETLEGGIPMERSLLVAGSAGCGKTVLLGEFIYRGIIDYDQNGVFVTFEERPNDIIKNFKNFGWDFDKLVKQNKLKFVDGSPEENVQEISGDYDWSSSLLARIKYAIKKTKAKRVAIDSLGVIFAKYAKFSSVDAVRDAVFQLADELKKFGVTVLISAEKSDDQHSLSKYGVEEFVSDGVIELDVQVGQDKIIRNIIIKKMRGVGFRSGRVEYEITKDGLQVFPKIPINRKIALTEFYRKSKFGVEGLDEALGGGIPQGHVLLCSGNTGTGKTTLGIHFAVEGIENNEKTIWVALEEPIPQIFKTAEAYGYNFEKYEKENKLSFIDVPLIDISFDKLLYLILDAVQRNGAKRVIIDSVSSLQSSTMNEEKVREFLIQISSFFKTLGITSLCTYLTADTFGASKDQLLGGALSNDMRLSTVVDGVIILNYVERGQRVRKLLNVLKLRGSDHKKDIFTYEIDKDGFKFGEKFEI